METKKDSSMSQVTFNMTGNLDDMLETIFKVSKTYSLSLCHYYLAKKIEENGTVTEEDLAEIIRRSCEEVFRTAKDKVRGRFFFHPTMLNEWDACAEDILRELLYVKQNPTVKGEVE